MSSRLGAASFRLFMLVAALLMAPLLAFDERGSTAHAVGVRVPILVYHAVDYSGSEYSVTPEQLDEQCRWLIENGYTSITIGQFWDAASSGGMLPPKPVVLTNDDGWASAMVFADTLGRYGLVGTYFINNTSPLTPEQIVSLSHRGGVEAHTATHSDLAGMDYQAQLAEIQSNKLHLEQITGKPVRFLAWPYGSSDGNAVQAATAAGIVAAFGLHGTAADPGALDPYYVPRLMVMVTDDLATFTAKVSSW